MAELKTKQNDESVEQFLNNIEDKQKQQDCFEVLKLMQETTGHSPKMWGGSIVGFGNYHYKYDSGREGDWFITGFSPRKQYISLYLMYGFDRDKELMQALGKFKHGKACLNIKKLGDINMEVLKELVVRSVDHMSKK